MHSSIEGSNATRSRQTQHAYRSGSGSLRLTSASASQPSSRQMSSNGGFRQPISRPGKSVSIWKFFLYNPFHYLWSSPSPSPSSKGEKASIAFGLSKLGLKEESTSLPDTPRLVPLVARQSPSSRGHSSGHHIPSSCSTGTITSPSPLGNGRAGASHSGTTQEPGDKGERGGPADSSPTPELFFPPFKPVKTHGTEQRLRVKIRLDGDKTVSPRTTNPRLVGRVPTPRLPPKEPVSIISAEEEWVGEQPSLRPPPTRSHLSKSSFGILSKSSLSILSKSSLGILSKSSLGILSKSSFSHDTDYPLDSGDTVNVYQYRRGDVSSLSGLSEVRMQRGSRRSQRSSRDCKLSSQTSDVHAGSRNKTLSHTRSKSEVGWDGMEGNTTDEILENIQQALKAFTLPVLTVALHQLLEECDIPTQPSRLHQGMEAAVLKDAIFRSDVLEAISLAQAGALLQLHCKDATTAPQNRESKPLEVTFLEQAKKELESQTSRRTSKSGSKGSKNWDSQTAPKLDVQAGRSSQSTKSTAEEDISLLSIAEKRRRHAGAFPCFEYDAMDNYWADGDAVGLTPSLAPGPGAHPNNAGNSTIPLHRRQQFVTMMELAND